MSMSVQLLRMGLLRMGLFCLLLEHCASVNLSQVMLALALGYSSHKYRGSRSISSASRLVFTKGYGDGSAINSNVLH